jgi:hypothetical protein
MLHRLLDGFNISSIFVNEAKWLNERSGCTRNDLLLIGILILRSRFLIMQQLDYNNGRAVFSTWDKVS